ncbi:helix-turn-helix domain-containing protein [Enterobacter roggenkampii]
MKPTQQNRPVSYIKTLLDVISLHEKKTFGVYGTRIYLQRNENVKCICLYEGQMAAYRNNGVLFSHVTEPTIFGMNVFYNKRQDLNVRFLSDCCYIILSVESCLDIIREHNLWEAFSYLSMYATQKTSEISMSIVGENTKQIVFSILQEVYNLNRLCVNGKKINASEYIIEKTGLSRSLVMKELKILNDSGKITIKRGILEEIKDF